MRNPASTRAARSFAAALVLLAGLLATAGCPGGKSGDKPGTGGGAASGDALTVTLALTSPSEGNHQATARLEASRAVQALQLTFEVPAECRIIAGAAVRNIAQIAPGAPIAQEIAFDCPAGTKGALKAKVAGKDAAGVAVEESAEGSF
jgi:hypothetical protein